MMWPALTLDPGHSDARITECLTFPHISEPQGIQPEKKGEPHLYITDIRLQFYFIDSVFRYIILIILK